jgi:alpha-beta hydrolase superfamily lysophospholipase
MPAHKLTGEGLDLHPSDNIDMLRALSRDPLVIKATRVDVLYGVSNLMDQAVGQGNHMNKRALILYGKHDDIIPRESTCQWLQSLPAENSQLRQILIYENGYHMLTRDLQAKVVLKDIADWITGEVNPITNRQDSSTIETFCPEVTAPRQVFE